MCSGSLGLGFGFVVSALLIAGCGGNTASSSSRPDARGGSAGAGGLPTGSGGAAAGTAGSEGPEGGFSGFKGDNSTGGDTSEPAELGKPCTTAEQCGLRATCDVVSGVCVWPCAQRGSQFGSKTVACASGRVCVQLSEWQPLICKIPCDGTNCPSGLVCSEGFCLREGTVRRGMRCNDSFGNIEAACKTPDLSCTRRGICEGQCDPRSANPGCSSGEQCAYDSICTRAGDSAPLGALCTQNVEVCGGDGSVWRGVCSSEGPCVPHCETNADCPAPATCNGRSCVTPCDRLAKDPGCPALTVCKGFVCDGRPGDPARVREPCTLENQTDCGSDGLAYRGYCIRDINGVPVCEPYCRTDDDCAEGEGCFEDICYSRPRI